MLADILPNPIDTIYFVNSGAEATEGALKLAKRATGRSEILAFHNAYHGSTHGALSVMGSDFFKKGYGPLLPDVGFLQYNDFSDLSKITTKTACVIAESIQGEAGAKLPNRDWLIALKKRCTETGTLLILDEIQTGFGRTGACFAFRHFGIVPDIVLMAKGMGGGIPNWRLCGFQRTHAATELQSAFGPYYHFWWKCTCMCSSSSQFGSDSRTRIYPSYTRKGIADQKFIGAS
jgi:acetylornithine/N-succinyldiaminopimelate aminotransferase